MKKFKYLAIIIVVISFVTGICTTSCEKRFGTFLEQAPGVNVTLDTLFSSQTYVEKFMATLYEIGMPALDGTFYAKFMGSPSNSNSIDNNFSSYANSCDESKNPTSWYSCWAWNTGTKTIGSMTQEDAFWTVRWNAIHDCYLLLNKVDAVPDVDQTYKDQMKGEAKWIIAANYFEMLERRGGHPIVTGVIDVTKDIVKINRSSVDSTIQFIVKNCDEAAAVLPDAWPPNWRGRATKGAALGLKARTLLWGASPLFNTATPYLSMANPTDNRLICYGNYDVSRWKLAADAAKAVLDWAPAGGVALVTDKGVDKNYKYVWESYDNPEIILADKSTNANDHNGYDEPWSSIFPMAINGVGWGGNCNLQNFIEKFYDNRYTGKPMAWKDNGTDLNQKYDSMDYRFKQSIAYNGSYWNAKWGIIETFQNGKYANGCVTGYWMRKWIPDAFDGSDKSAAINFQYLRLAEFYLTYAEALNEYNGTPPQEAYDAVNAIRERSGMPDLPTGLSQAQFRDRVRKEWAVEFIDEDKRFWDIHRWLIAEEPGVMQGPVTGLKITKGAIVGGVQQFSYQRFVLENRVWWPNYYLLGFRQTEVNKGYLVQNPGW